jgi:hypothetical protein
MTQRYPDERATRLTQRTVPLYQATWLRFSEFRDQERKGKNRRRKMIVRKKVEKKKTVNICKALSMGVSFRKPPLNKPDLQ